MTPLRVVLADDHTLVRAGIRALIEKLPEVEVVGEASSGEEAIERVREAAPDVVLMDIGMAGQSGLEAAQEILGLGLRTKIVMLSMFGSEAYVLQALRVGASGYLLKDAAASELELALAVVRQGGTFLSPQVSKLLSGNHPREGETALTERQVQVLRLLAEGKNVKEAAFLLNISSKTVETHRTQIMDRLGIHDLPGLVRYAIRAKLIAR